MEELNKVGRKIYFDLTTGNVILDTGEMCGSVKETTVDEDFMTFKELSIRVRETVGVRKLSYGAYAQDFSQCNGYKINIQTEDIEFSYPDPNVPQPQEPVYQKPLSEQIKELQQSVIELSMMLATPQP